MSREQRFAYNKNLFSSSSSSSSSDSSGDIENEERDRENERQDREYYERRRSRRSHMLAMSPIIHQNLVDDRDGRGGTRAPRRYTFRDRSSRKALIMFDYFADNSRYSNAKFRRRFRMNRDLFLRILNGIAEHDIYFRDEVDGLGRDCVSGLQKAIAAIRILAYGVCGDFLDEYLHIGESTAMKSLERFCDGVIACFEPVYLRNPTEEDVHRIMNENEARGFPGMLGSIDCMHWTWKNCPTGWAGQYKGHMMEPTIILEAVVDKRLWFWHMFFGVPGSNNDVNVLQRSNVFQQVIHGDGPRRDFTVNEHTYKLGYYLADGIYPSYATLVKTIRQPQTGKERNFAKRQEAARKDVERGFGVLQSRWHILKHSAHSHRIVFLGKMIKTCIIMHNMIVENEGEEGVLNWRPESGAPVPTLFKDLHFQQKVFQMIQGRQEIRSKGVHMQLQQDLVEHLWRFDAENHEPQEAPPIYEDSTGEEDVQEEDFDNVANFLD